MCNGLMILRHECTLRERDVTLSKVKARIRKTANKYGVEVPRSVELAYKLGRKNGNTLWRDAIDKEMTNIGVAFGVLEEGKSAPIGWTKVTGHMIFDVKMFITREARWVLYGHKTMKPVVLRMRGSYRGRVCGSHSPTPL